jgi:hypothetical protein
LLPPFFLLLQFLYCFFFSRLVRSNIHLHCANFTLRLLSVAGHSAYVSRLTPPPVHSLLTTGKYDLRLRPIAIFLASVLSSVISFIRFHSHLLPFIFVSAISPFLLVNRHFSTFSPVFFSSSLRRFPFLGDPRLQVCSSNLIFYYFLFLLSPFNIALTGPLFFFQRAHLSVIDHYIFPHCSTFPIFHTENGHQ